MKTPDTPSAVLAWLHEFASRVIFQDFAAGVLRQKNRVIVEFRRPDGAIVATGARSISTAVAKAAILRTAKSRAEEARENANI